MNSNVVDRLVENGHIEGEPSSSKKNVKKVHDLVLLGRQVAIRQIVK